VREPGGKTTGNAGKSAPVYEMLERHAERRMTAFHVPGHKQRTDWLDEAADARYGPLLALDVTELDDTDDLHHPAGAIAKAQRLAAACFGAEETCFLVGGSTAGNLAMILGTTAPGDLLIVQRNVHRSIFHGLTLAGVRAVLLQPEIDAGSGIAVIPAADRVREAAGRYPEARGVVLSSPNYYGMSGDLRPIADVCHAAGMPLLVDEAHGAHFGLHPQFPVSALQAGADIVVQSTHKMLGAMTMGAMLHMQGAQVDREAVRQALRMVQSSSPSFPLLASLDLARRQVHAGGEAAFAPALAAAARVRAHLPRTAFRGAVAENSRGTADDRQAISQDPLKLMLYDARGMQSGFQLRDELAARNCAIEMADARYAVLAFGIGTRQEDADRLIEALADMSGSDRPPQGSTGFAERQASNSAEQPQAAAAGHEPASGSDYRHRGISTERSGGATERSEMPTEWNREMTGQNVPLPNRGDAADVPAPALFSRVFPQTERVRLEESVGRIAGEWVVPYPPGIPELYPGEIVTEQAIERLLHWRGQGAQIQGAEDADLRYLRVTILS